MRFESPEHCTAPDCSLPLYNHRYCMWHAKMHRKYGNVDRPLPDIALTTPLRMCKVTNCKRTFWAYDYCSVHYDRWRRCGDPLADQEIKSSRQFIIGPSGAHMRCVQMWGAAKNYACTECGRNARDWAYDGTDPTQMLGRSSNSHPWMYYSLFPEFYMPMCVKCHRGRDGAVAARELREYRVWKHMTGFSLPRLMELGTDDAFQYFPGKNIPTPF